MNDSDFISWAEFGLENHKDDFSSTLIYAIESGIVQVSEERFITDLRGKFVRIMEIPGITICPVMGPDTPLIIRLGRNIAQSASTGELVTLSK